MRISVVLLSVLTFIFSSIPLFSQSVSFGRPSGFIRIEIQPNEEKLASMPFDSSTPSLSSQIFGLTGGFSENSGDQIKLWDAVRQAYIQAFLADGTGDSEKDGCWLDASLNPSGIILVPGVGFFIRNNHGTVQSAYLAGKLPLDNSRKTTLYPSLNLFSYPFASKISINSSGISFFGNAGARPDKIYLSISGPSYSLVEEDGIRKWINFKGNDSEIELRLGNAVWYENNGIANVISQDDSPYSNLFGKEDLPPSIAFMALGQSKDEIILTINCTQVPGEILEIFSKDLVENDALATGSGWLIAGHNIIPGGAAQIQWTDSGNLKPAFPYALRERTSRIYGRLFMVSRQDMDSDKDGISNGREIFVYGTDPKTNDTDGDGASDYEEIVNLKTSPVEADSRVDAPGQLENNRPLMQKSTPLFAPGPALPAGWHHQDIGIPLPPTAMAGTATYDPDAVYPSGVTNPKFSVSASGTDIYGTADHFHYCYQELYGNCEIIARVASQTNTNTNAWAKAGIMVRQTLDSNSRNAFVFLTPTNGANFQYRPSTTTGRVAGAGSFAAPYWLKLVKNGDTYTTSQSQDGSNWVQISNYAFAAAYSMGNAVKVGFAVTSMSNSSLSSATFDSISITRSFTASEAPVFTPASGYMRYGQKVEMNPDAVPGSEIWYTLDGSEPVNSTQDSSSMRYDGPLTITRNCTVKAKRYMDGYATSPLAVADYTMAGLMVKYYDLNCSVLPTPVTVQPYKVSMIPDMNFPANKDGTILTSGKTDYVYAEITGKVICPVAGNYTFYLISSDGSALYLSGARIINNDGLQGMTQAYTTRNLDPGTYEIKVAYFNSTGATGGLGGLQLKWAYPGHGADFMTPDEFVSDDTEKDGLPDQWELTHGNLDQSGDDDADSDGWSNAEELNLYMTDPDDPESVPAAASNPVDTTEKALVVTYCKRNSRTWAQVPDLPNLPKFGAETVSKIDYARGLAIFATSGYKTDIGAMFSGYIEVPTSGIYKFYLNCDDGANLHIDGKQVVCNDGLHTMRETYGIVGMEAGKHEIRVDYYQTATYNGLIMQYEGPGIEKQIVPSSVLSYSNQYLKDMLAEDDPNSDGVHTITASAGANGTISPVGNVTVNYYGDNQKFTFTPNVNYHVSDILVDNVSAGAATSYQFTNVRRDHNIKVSFALDTHTVTFVEGAGGTITGDKIQSIPFGGNCSQVTAVPNPGYSFVNWTGTAGFSVTDVNPLSVSNITSEMTITANFANDTFAITATAGANGSITPDGEVFVRTGTDRLFTITPDANYHVSDVLVDGASVGAVTTYEFENVTAAHTITAIFAINTFTITASAGANGSISPAGPVSADYGSAKDFTITPSANFQISDVLVDNVSVGAVPHYQFTDVTAAHTISASFAPVGTIPSFWHEASIGSAGTVGSAVCNFAVNPPVFTITGGAGTEIYGKSDKFYYLYQELNGNCEMIVKITSQQNSNALAKAGLMIRQTLAAGSKNAFVFLTPANGSPFQQRTAADDATARIPSTGAKVPYWIKLVKDGDSYSAYKSSDGLEWKAVVTNKTIEMGDSVKVGFGLASFSGTASSTAEFSNFSITRTLTAAPVITPTPEGGYLQMDKSVEMDPEAVSGSEIWYTVGSSVAETDNIPVKDDKTGFSKKYTAPFNVDASCVVKARRFMAGYNPSQVSTKMFNQPGLMVKYYSERKDGTWTTLPWNILPTTSEFDVNMTPYKLSMIPKLDYPNTINSIMTSGRADNVGAVITGYVNFPVTGDYTFSISSGEGARMYLDDKPIPIINVSKLMEYTTAGTSSLVQKGMAAGFHRIRIEYFEASGNGGIQLRWKHPLQATSAVIPVEAFFSLDTDLDGISDQWTEYMAAYLVSHPDYTPASDDDTDGDGIIDRDELNIYGTDPLDPADKPMVSSNPSDSALKIAVSYCARNNRTWTHVPDLGSLPVFVKEDTPLVKNDPPDIGLVSNINFPKLNTAFATSELKTDVAARFKGYIELPSDGVYKFYLECDDGANLYIDGMKIVDNDGLHVMIEEYGSASLMAGMHEIMVDYYQTTSYSGLILRYEGPDIKKQIVPPEILFHSDSYVNDPVTGLAARNDADSDGLTDAKENDPLFDPDDIFRPDDWDSLNLKNSTMDGERVEPTPSTGSITSDWKDLDIGATGKEGSANLDSSVFTVRGAGSLLPSSTTEDAFNFCYQELYGDCEVSARVIFQGNTNEWAKAGLMIRKSTDVKSQYAFAYLTPGNGANYLQRAMDAGKSGANIAGSAAVAPCWLKLVKKGMKYTPYMSHDGANWIRIGKPDQTVDMGDTVLVGFAVTSMNTGILSPACFDNFSITRTLTVSPEISSDKKGYYQGTRSVSIENKSGVPESFIRYSEGIADPSEDYTAAFDISGNAIVRARLFKDGYQPGPITEAFFTEIPSLLVKYYSERKDGNGKNLPWDALPTSSEFDNSMTPYKVGMIPDIDCPDTNGRILTSGHEENVGAVITGKVICPVSGSYSFFVTSGEGFAFHLDGEELLRITGKRASTKSKVSAQTLSAGLHDIRIEYFEKDKTGGITLSWKPAGSTVESIMTPSDFFCDDIDGDKLADEWEKYAFPDIWSTRVHDGTEDTDGDCTSDRDELNLYLTDPLLPLDRPYLADTSAKPEDLSTGVAVSYLTGAYKLLPDFPGVPHYGTAVVPQKPEEPTFSYSYPATKTPDGCFLTSGKYDNVGAYFKGYLNIPAGGAYRFQLECDDLAVMEIDGVKVIDCNVAALSATNPDRLNTGFMPLKAGRHPFSISYYENTSSAKLILRYEGPGFKGLELVPEGMFSYSNKYFTAQTDTDDDDFDGLSNKIEATLGTDPKLADTDGDGISDYDEVQKEYNPLAVTKFYYVDYGRNTDAGLGTSWGTAKKYIQSGINLCKTDGKEYVVKVKAGTYLHNLSASTTKPADNVNLSFGTRNLKLDADGGSVVIDCEDSYRAFNLSGSVDSTSWIRGFTIRNGKSLDNGAGINLNNASPRIINCVFENNHVDSIMGEGGAVYCGNSSPQFINCIFKRNSAGKDGGAVYSSLSSPSFRKCEFSYNVAGHYGGALFFNGTPGKTALVENCALIGNRGVANYGAIGVSGEGSMNIINSTFARNFTKGAVSGLGVGNISLTVKNSIVRDDIETNTTGAKSVNYSYTIADMNAYGSNNAVTDPKINPKGYLLTSSPCIDAGNPDGAPGSDIHGETRPASAGIDIGCDEFIDSDGDGIPDWCEKSVPGGLTSEGDYDADGITNIQEYLNGTRPALVDSDGDGMNDKDELDIGSDPAAYTRFSYVDGAIGNDLNDGLSLQKAKKTIQAGLEVDFKDASESVVKVAPLAEGYKGLGNVELDFNGRDVKLLSGGTAENVIIDCENSKRAFLFTNRETSRNCVNGFTIRNSFVDESSPNGAKGGALYISASSPLFKNCVFISNSALLGGAVYASLSNAEFENCEFSSNSCAAGSGGAVYAENNSVIKFTRCVFRENSAISGGGIALSDSTAEIYKSTFHGNLATNGAAMFAGQDSRFRIENTIVRNNTASVMGGALFSELSGKTFDIVNSTFFANQGTGLSDGIYVDSGAPLLNILNSIVENHIVVSGGTVNVNYSCTMDDSSGQGSGNINVDPILTVGGLLQSTSPCINAGTNTGAPPIDIHDEQRPYGSVTDMGADEFIDTDNDVLADWWEMTYFGTLTPNANGDFDHDGGSNIVEYLNSTDPASTSFRDADNDGLDDAWEMSCFLDLDENPEDNPDNDELTNLKEYQYGIDPTSPDTDGDGLKDNDEINIYHTDPANPDSDDDRLTDGQEVNLLNPTLPNNSDTDGDAMNDGWELANGLNPLLDDSALDPDNDGLLNIDEYRNGTKINLADSDGDGISDGDEVNVYYANPTDSNSYPKNISILYEFEDGKRNSIAQSVVSDTGSTKRYPAELFNGGNVTLTDGGKLGTALIYASNSSLLTKLSNVTVDWGRKFVLEARVFKGGETSGRIDLVKSETSSVLEWYIDSDGKMKLSLDGGSDFLVSTEQPVLTDGTWTELQCVVDLSKTNLNDAVKMYVAAVPAALSPSSTFGEPFSSGKATLSDKDKIIMLQRDAQFSMKTDFLKLMVQAVFDTFNTDKFHITDSDTDKDGLRDSYEFEYFGDLSQNRDGDYDGDCITNGEEFASGSNPTSAEDADGDGLSDGYEIKVSHTDPLKSDTDTDGMPDGWEVRYGLNPLVNDATRDLDSDGLSNINEFTHGADPTNKDTDGDHLRDGLEVARGLDPLTYRDSDNDGLSDDWERFFFGNLLQGPTGDPDGDHLTNGQEYECSGKYLQPIIKSAYDETTRYLYDPSPHSSIRCYVSRYRTALDGRDLKYYVKVDVKSKEISYVDVDEDLIPDDWEHYYFGAANTERQIGKKIIHVGGRNLEDSLEIPLENFKYSYYYFYFFPLKVTPTPQVDETILLSTENNTYTFLPEGLRACTKIIDKNEEGEIKDDDHYDDDFDKDGISNYDEFVKGRNPAGIDSDGDGILDHEEAAYGIDNGDDNDGDGLINSKETANHTDMNKFDSDGDGMNDGYEVDNKLNPKDDKDANIKGEDGKTNKERYDEKYFNVNVSVYDGDDIIGNGDDSWIINLNGKYVASTISGNNHPGTCSLERNKNSEHVFTMIRPETGQMDGTDEYMLTINAPAGCWTAGNNNPTMGPEKLNYSLTGAPPDTSHLKWTFFTFGDMIDADVDNSGGEPDDADDKIEGIAPGLVVMVNDDNDDFESEPNSKKELDCSNTRIDGGKDKEDMKKVIVRKFNLSSHHDIKLNVSNITTAGKIRLFNNTSGKLFLDAGVSESADIFDLIQDSDLELLVEGVEPGQLKLQVTFDGVIKDEIFISTVKLDMVPDWNRDGKIDESDNDKVTPGRPWRFWINDNIDTDAVTGIDHPVEKGNPNYYNNHVDSVRDFVDFFPVQLKIKDILSLCPADKYDYVLKHDMVESEIDGGFNAFIDTGVENGIVADNAGRFLFEEKFCERNTEHALVHVSSDGYILPNTFLDGVKTGSYDVILLEGCFATKKPLVLEIRSKADQKIIFQVEMPVSLDKIDKMFRHKNLRGPGNIGEQADRLFPPPNYPDEERGENSKNFVYIHGYNVGENFAWGAHCAFFKKLFWSGSNAKFHGITWRGDQSMIQYGGELDAISLNFPVNIINAFKTAESLKVYINKIEGNSGSGNASNVVVAAHSLGNMLASAAISIEPVSIEQEPRAKVKKYFIMNGAVPMEAYNPGEEKVDGMRHPEWDDYKTADFLSASEWHSLFPGNDPRSEMTWRGLFQDMNGAECYDLYSTGDQIMINIPHELGVSLIGWEFWKPVAAYYPWGSQEKIKGTGILPNMLADWHCWSGWGFNKDDYGSWMVDALGVRIPPWTKAPLSSALLIPQEQLKTKPFFLKAPSDLFSADEAAARTYALQNKEQLLTLAFPATTFGIGANPIGGGKITYKDMNATKVAKGDIDDDIKTNGWPQSRVDEKDLRWKHGDYQNVAFIYTNKVYKYIVEKGGIK